MGYEVINKRWRLLGRLRLILVMATHTPGELKHSREAIPWYTMAYHPAIHLGWSQVSTRTQNPNYPKEDINWWKGHHLIQCSLGGWRKSNKQKNSQGFHKHGRTSDTLGWALHEWSEIHEEISISDVALLTNSPTTRKLCAVRCWPIHLVSHSGLLVALEQQQVQPPKMVRCDVATAMA